MTARAKRMPQWPHGSLTVWQGVTDGVLNGAEACPPSTPQSPATVTAARSHLEFAWPVSLHVPVATT